MFASFLPNLITYFSYLGCGVLLLAAFSLLYAKVTPIDEIKLIREGCIAAALSYGGALIGFSLALTSSAWHVNRIEFFLIWGVLAMLVQILVHIVISRCIKGINQGLIEDNVALGALSGSISLAVGLINAGSLS